MQISHPFKSVLVLCTLLATVASGNASPEDFTLQAATGKGEFKLSAARGKFVALHFLLKTECPFCLRHTQSYLSQAGSLPNVVQVFVKPDTEAEIKAWAGKLPAELLAATPIYRDPDAALARQFNIPDGYRFHGHVVHFPALVLLDPDGKEVFRYVGRNNTDRYSFEKLVEKVKSLSKAEGGK